MRCALVRTLDHFSCDLAQNLQKYSRIMCSRKRDSTSLDDSLTNIQWLCSLDSNPLLDQEEEKTIHSPTETTSMNPYPKPPFSYATLILLAINSTEEKRMTLQDIYKWIEDNFPYYQHCKKAWKNSIRHNLSLHSFFLKAKRPSTLPGKGSYWLISPEGKENIMKEVMKHQQPHVRPNLNAEQSVTKALRPILPKPSDNLLISSHIVNSPSTGNVKFFSDASVTGLPVVILPTHMYMNMANKIAAQAAAGNVAAIGVNPTFLPITTSCSSTDNQNFGDVVNHNGAGQRYGQETESNLTGKVIQEVNSQVTSSLSQIAIENSQEKSLIRSVEQLLFETESQENEIIFEGCDNSTIVSTSSKSHWESGNNHLNEERNETREMLAPCTKKRKSEKRKSTVHVDEKTSSPNKQKKQTLCQSTPLRPCPQPTLAAINSQANDLMASPGFFFSRHNTSDLADISPVKLMITPTKTCGSHNFLSSLLGSPITSSNLGCTGLTPLNYASDSGILTPLKEGEMDFGFLFSPERLGSSKICSTPQRCRKSLGLGLSSTTHNSKALADSQYSSNDADFLKL